MLKRNQDLILDLSDHFSEDKRNKSASELLYVITQSFSDIKITKAFTVVNWKAVKMNSQILRSQLASELYQHRNNNNFRNYEALMGWNPYKREKEGYKLTFKICYGDQSFFSRFKRDSSLLNFRNTVLKIGPGIWAKCYMAERKLKFSLKRSWWIISNSWERQSGIPKTSMDIFELTNLRMFNFMRSLLDSGKNN